LQTLQAGATYSWGDHAAHFTGGQPVVDSSDLRSGNALRNELTRVLRSHGWREVSVAESPMYQLALGRYQRWFEVRERVAERVQRISDTRHCQHLSPAARVECESPRAQYSTVVRRDREVHLAFAIVRSRDGATAWWVARNTIDLQRMQIEMLSRDSGDTAFGR